MHNHNRKSNISTAYILYTWIISHLLSGEPVTLGGQKLFKAGEEEEQEEEDNRDTVR